MAATTQRRRRGSSGLDWRILLAAVVIVAGAAALWLLWVSPAMSKTADLEQQVTSTSTQVEATTVKVTALQGGQQSPAVDLLRQARELDEQLPTGLENVAVAGQVATMAAARGLQVDKMDSVNTAGADGRVGMLEFSGAVSGAYDQVLGFLQDLTGPQNPVGLMTVSNVSLSVGSNTAASFTLRAYYASTPPL